LVGTTADFRRPGPRRPLLLNHLPGENRQTMGRIGEVRLIAILSDINMPGMDGLDLLDEVKRRYPELPVMMVTAFGDDDRRRRAKELGAAEFLTKPVDFDLPRMRLRQSPNAAD
jgi:CheY-like chemotaxis protein